VLEVVVMLVLEEFELGAEPDALIVPVGTLFSDAMAVPVALVLLDVELPGGPPVPPPPIPPPPLLLPCRLVSCSLRI